MIKYQYIKKVSSSSVVIVVLLLFVLFQGIKLKRYKRNEIINHDVVSYYAYLPAAIIYHDLSFSFVSKLPENFKGRIWTFTSLNGRQTLKMPLGVALLWLPFFLLAHLISLVTGGAADGYGPVYQLFILLAAVFYLTAGLLYLRKVLHLWFNDRVTAITLGVVVPATNLLYYTSVEPGMSHVYSFFLFSGFLWHTLRWYEHSGLRDATLLALFGGLILVVRPTNGLVFLVPVLYGMLKYKYEWFRFLWKNRYRLLWVAGVVLVPVFLQLLYWKYSTGKWFFYSYGEERFFFSHPHILEGLFSYRKGWLVYTPVMFLSLAGFVWLYKKSTALFWSILVYFLLNLYVVFSWWCWWYGGSFGARPLIETYALLVLPLAAFIERITRSKLWIRIPVYLLFLFFIYLNLFQMRQYRITLLHWDSTSKALYWKVFLSNKWPDNYKQLLNPPDYREALKTGIE